MPGSHRCCIARKTPTAPNLLCDWHHSTCFQAFCADATQSCANQKRCCSCTHSCREHQSCDIDYHEHVYVMALIADRCRSWSSKLQWWTSSRSAE